MLVLAALLIWYRSHQQSLRRQDLQAALDIAEAQIGQPNQFGPTFPTQDAKQQAEIKAFSGVAAKYPGTREGLIAQYYVGTIQADRGEVKQAEANLRNVADSSSDFASLATIALAQVYAGENKVAEAQALLRSLINKPADLVSKTQAQILLAQLDVTADPKQAKKILQSLRKPNEPPSTSRAVDQVMAQISK